MRGLWGLWGFWGSDGLATDIFEGLGDVVEEVEFAAVGFVKVLAGEGFGGGSAGDDAHVEEDEVIKIA